MAVVAVETEGDLNAVVNGPLDFQKILPQLVPIHRKGLLDGADVFRTFL